MKRGLAAAAALLSLALWAGSAGAVEVAGVQVAERARVGDADLVLNGAGTRTWFVFKVYVAALYGPQRGTSAEALADGVPRRMELRMLRDLSVDKLLGALREGLEKNETPDEAAALAPSTEKLAAIFRAAGDAKEGDAITLDFAAGGLTVGVNGRTRGRIDDPAFGRALLRVWLGMHPADAGLKKALLGG